MMLIDGEEAVPYKSHCCCIFFFESCRHDFLTSCRDCVLHAIAADGTTVTPSKAHHTRWPDIELGDDCSSLGPRFPSVKMSLKFLRH